MAKGSSPIASIASNDEWQVEEDLRTICRAREIEKDPKRMAKVKEMANKKVKEMASVVGDGKK